MEVMDYQPKYVAGLGKLRKKCTPIPVPPPRVPSPMPPPGFKRASLPSTATGLAPSPPPVKKGQSRPREFNEDISEPWINPRILLKINKEKLLQTISPALGEEDRKIPSQVNGGQNNVLSFKTEKSAVESRSKPLLCYQKPSSPVTCLARTRKIQVIQSIASDHSVNDAENIPRHGGSQLSCREDIQISSNRDLTASTSKNMETNVLENYKLMFRNKIRVFENADANHSHNQNNSQCKGSNKTVSTKPFAENFRQMDKSNAYSLKENNSSHKTNESTNAGDSYSSENNFKSNFNKIGSNITKEFSDREQSSFKSVIHQDLRDGNFRDKFKASRPHLNEFSNADAMYKVSKVYPPSSYTLTQMTTSVAVEFFARAAQKMSQTSAATSSSTSTPHKKKRHEEEGEGKVGFSGVIHRSPPQIPAALLRKIGIKETTSVGKVKVMLKISKADDSLTSAASSASPPFLSVDSRKRQITLLEPGGIGIQNGAPEERRVGVAAPKMFAFDAIFSDEPQSEICTSALSDVIQAVISGSDGCLFCFGHARLGKSYTMVGTPQSSATLGVIPSAISWLFRCISEQKHKTGARFSVRASAIEISSSSQHVKDLLSTYSNDQDQSPGVYLCEEPQLQSELRVPTPEKAAFYLDAALSARTSSECHFLYSLHVYQYSVAGKGGVAGGRSRLHVLDLGSCERVKGQSAMTLSAVGNVLIAIFNGQKHLPHREHRLAQVLKECLGSITCHAAMLAHVSPLPEHYHETLATIQLASRLHRMRRRRVKYVGSTGMNTTNISNCVEDSRGPSSSDVDPSSSEQSADTVIYVGHNRSNHEETDGEHPPVYIPSLTSGDNRAVMSKALPSKPVPKVLPQTKLSNTSKSVPASPQKLSDPSKLMSSPSKSSKALKSSSAKSSPCKVLPSKAQIEEQWIDGPKISKSRIAEARMNIKKEKEMWVDGPKPSKKHDRHEVNHSGYGFLDSHKKNMIRKWVENQTLQVQQKKAGVGQSSSSSSGSGSGSGGSGSGSGSGASGLSSASATYRGLTQFKTCDEDDDMRCLPGEVRGRASGQEDSEEFDDYVMTANPLPLPPKPAALPKGRVVPLDRLQDSSVLHEKLPDNLVPTSQSNVFIRERSDLNINIDKSAIQNSNLNHLHSKETSSTAVYNNISIERVPDDSQTDIEIIEVEIPMEPVPMMDCALQVTEEDILRSMKSPGSVNSNLHEEDLMLKSLGQNPLPEEDQNHNVDLMEHPLKILSQSNLTVVSTFTDSLSVTNDLERLFPHRTTGRAFAMYPWSSSPFQPKEYYANLTKVSSEALSRLDELHRNRYQSRCHSSSFSEADVHSDVDNSSVVSEPAYFPGSDMNKTFCDNCHSSLSCFSKKFMDSRTPHSNMSRHLRNLRHPDGSSNPNLQEDTKEFSRIPGAGAEEDEEMPCPVPPPLHSNLLTLSRDSLISNKRNDNSSLYSNSNERLHDPGGTGSIKSFRNFGFGSGIQYCKNDLETLEQYCKNDFNQSTWRNDRLEQLKREKRALLIELAATKTHLSQSALIKETVTK